MCVEKFSWLEWTGVQSKARGKAMSSLVGKQLPRKETGDENPRLEPTALSPWASPLEKK